MEETDIMKFFANYEVLFVEKNHPIHLNTEPWSHVFFLHKGIAIVKRIHADGTEELLRFAKENNFIGIPNYFTASRQLAEHDTSIYACTDCILYKFSANDFHTLSYQHPEILEFIIIKIGLENHLFRKQMDNISHKKTINALASLLIDMKIDTPSGMQIPACLTNNDIATYLKIHFVTVSKMLHALIKNGILEKREKQLYIRHYEKLLALANNQTTLSLEV